MSSDDRDLIGKLERGEISGTPLSAGLSIFGGFGGPTDDSVEEQGIRPREGRISREEMFFSIAWTIGQRSTCPRAEVGAIAVRNNRIVASGYVGAPSGQEHCLEVGCRMENGGCVRTVHAEANVIAFAARAGLGLYSTHLYSTHEPCLHCAKLIVNAGIKQVHFRTAYRNHDGSELLRRLGVRVTAYQASGENSQPQV